MKTLICMYWLGVVGLAPLGADPARANDAERLQGTWVLVGVEYNGKKLPMDDLQKGRLDIKGKQYVFQLRETRMEITFTLDAGKKPRTIDLKVVQGPEKGSMYRGIYVLERDTYTICRTTKPDQKRPTEFTTKPESELLKVVWKRMNGK